MKFFEIAQLGYKNDEEPYLEVKKVKLKLISQNQYKLTGVNSHFKLFPLVVEILFTAGDCLEW